MRARHAGARVFEWRWCYCISRARGEPPQQRTPVGLRYLRRRRDFCPLQAAHIECVGIYYTADAVRSTDDDDDDGDRHVDIIQATSCLINSVRSLEPRVGRTLKQTIKAHDLSSDGHHIPRLDLFDWRKDKSVLRRSGREIILFIPRSFTVLLLVICRSFVWRT